MSIINNDREVDRGLVINDWEKFARVDRWLLESPSVSFSIPAYKQKTADCTYIQYHTCHQEHDGVNVHHNPELDLAVMPRWWRPGAYSDDQVKNRSTTVRCFPMWQTTIFVETSVRWNSESSIIGRSECARHCAAEWSITHPTILDQFQHVFMGVEIVVSKLLSST